MLVLTTRELVNEITKSLFAPEHRRMTKLQLELIQRHKALSGSDIDGFYYNGNTYTDRAIQHRCLCSNLHPSLVPDVDEWERTRKHIGFQEVQVHMGLAALVVDCRSMQDLRDCLPDCVAADLEPLKNFKRTREDGYTVKNNPRKYRQYLELKEKLEYYSAIKLIY